MRLTNIQEAPLMRVNFLLSQEKSKKGLKSVQPEINKISEILGAEFDKRLYQILFDEIDFKDTKTPLTAKNVKTQYFFKEFSILLDRQNFISVFSEILLHTQNNNTAQEIFDGINKTIKLSYENQFKLLLSFILSTNNRFIPDAKGILLSKCKELEREGKTDQISQNTIQTFLLMLSSFDTIRLECPNFINLIKKNSLQLSEEMKQNSDIEKLLEIGNDDTIEMERILLDLGPFIVNENVIVKDDMISYDIDEKRLAGFIIGLIEKREWSDNEEMDMLNKVFLKTINNEVFNNTIKEGDDDIKKKMIWNLDNFYFMFEKNIINLNKRNVFEELNYQGLHIKDKETFEYFLIIINKLKLIDNQSDVFDFIFSKWENELNQIELLELILKNDDIKGFSFMDYNGEKASLDSIEIKDKIAEKWKCIELIKVFLRLSSGNYYVRVKDIFSYPIKKIPEVIFIGLLSITQENDDFLYDELLQEIIMVFMDNITQFSKFIKDIWKTQKNIIIKEIISIYYSSPDNETLDKILYFTTQIDNSLKILVKESDYKFAVCLAIFAVKKGYLKIEEWLKERIENVGDDFIKALLNYILENMVPEIKEEKNPKGNNSSEESLLSLESLAIIFENLVNTKEISNSKRSQQIDNFIKEVYKLVSDKFRELQSPNSNHEEIEKKANTILEELLKGKATVPEIMEKLFQLKRSTKEEEQLIFACVIHCILDEYRFYDQYPEKQLNSISMLYGQILSQKLLDGLVEIYALKNIEESIKKGSGSIFIFGITALKQFADKLLDFPDFLTKIAKLQQLRNVFGLYEVIQEKYRLLKGEITSPVNREKIEQYEHNVMSFLSPEPVQVQAQEGTNQYKGLKFSDLMTGKSEPINKISKTNEINPYQTNSGISIGFNQKSQKELNSFYMQNNQILDGFNMNPINPLESNISNMKSNPIHNMSMGNLNGMALSLGGHDNEERELRRQYGSYFDLKNQGQNIQRDENTSGFLNQSGNFSNLSSLSLGGNTPRRMLVSKGNSQFSIREAMREESEYQMPSQDTIDKINFIFNSMSTNNFVTKSSELKSILSDDSIIKWFSNSFIANRISVEINNHLLYNDMINRINCKELNVNLIKETIKYIQKILKKESIDKDKGILKNLGNWLGLITLKKNKPILAKDLDVKEILISAYETGKLLIIVPFLSKILEHSYQTKVFHQKNPWIQAILTLLNELHTRPNLKRNILFEIDSLFKKLEIDQQNYPKTKIFEKLTIPSHSPDFSKHQIIQHNGMEQLTLNINELYKKIIQADNYLANVSSIFNPNSKIFFTKQELATIFTQVLHSALKEIINPVIERTVNISLITTKELVIKDFIFELDDNKFFLSATKCIKSLAGSLAMITCKEPLRIGFNTRLKDLLLSKGFDTQTVETIINSQGNDLLDIGCSFIHNYVLKNAHDMIKNDEVIIGEIERRRKGLPELKSDIVAKINRLPELIRPNANGLTKEQFNIYENFDKVPEIPNLNHKTLFFDNIIKMLREVLETLKNTPMKIEKSYEMCMVNIQNNSHILQNFTEDIEDETKRLEKCITAFQVTDTKVAKGLAVISFKYALISMKRQNMYLLNIYCSLIKGWVDLIEEISREITVNLFTSSNISIQFNVDLHSTLIKKKIINFSDYEEYILECLDSPFTREQSISLLNGLNSQKMLSPFSRIKLFMLDSKLCNEYFSLFGSRCKLPSELNIKRESIIDYKKCNIKNTEKYDLFCNMSSFAFNQIIDNMRPFESFKLEKLKAKITKFLESPFVSNEEQMNVFIMLVTELCMKRGGNPQDAKEKMTIMNYFPEHEAKAIYGLLSVIPPNANKLKMFLNILNGIFKTFHYDYVKTHINFNQRPYFKLFYNLLHILNSYNNNDEIFNSEYKKINYISYFVEFLKIISPTYYPGFALAWLELISCNYFVKSILGNEDHIKENITLFEKYLSLIIDLFTFLRTNVKESFSFYSSKVFLDNIYKFMFCLCNSFPLFISGYYFILMISLPPGNSFLQLKNLILSCGPKEISKPDPFSEESKDINRKNASVLFDISSNLQDYGFKSTIDSFIETKSEKVIEELCKKFNKKKGINNYVINAIVVYLAQRLTRLLQEEKLKFRDFFNFFMKMLIWLDGENRDYLINSMMNELRYPSNQTFLFSSLIIFILQEAKNEEIEEHIIKNLFERMMYSPVPWGLKKTFVELLNAKNYPLKKKQFFIKCNGEEIVKRIMALFEAEKVKNNN